MCDRDANGFITKDELSTVCRQVSDEEVASSVLDNVMLCLDSDHDGRISFEEFKAGFQVTGAPVVWGPSDLYYCHRHSSDCKGAIIPPLALPSPPPQAPPSPPPQAPPLV